MTNADPEKVKAYQKAYAEKNKESLSAYKKAYAEANAEAIKAKKRAYYLANKERIKAKSRARFVEKHDEVMAYREENKERIAEYQKEYDKVYRQENAEKIAEYQQNYYRDNYDRLREEIEVWQKANPEKRKEYASRTKKLNKDRVNEDTRRRRALKLKATITPISKEELAAHVASYEGKCVYCGAPYKHIDHVLPLTRGGPHSLDNLRPACVSCNTSKGNRILNIEWVPKNKL